MFRKLRDEWAGRITLQASSIAPLDRFAGDEGAELADIVAESGGVLGMVTRLSGGIHDDIPPEFQAMLDHFFALAEARGLDLDLHVDESGETGARALREIALTALRRDFKGRIQCGHCCSLSRQTDEFALETIKACAEAGVAVVVLPMCNMYLQDREPGRTPRWRGVTLVHEMQTGGVSVSLASDNTRDPFYAYGDLDMVEVMREATRILHLDHPYGDWARSVGARPAAAMGLLGVRGEGAEDSTAALRALTEVGMLPASVLQARGAGAAGGAGAAEAAGGKAPASPLRRASRGRPSRPSSATASSSPCPTRRPSPLSRRPPSTPPAPAKAAASA
jgi:cytosine deaminase